MKRAPFLAVVTSSFLTFACSSGDPTPSGTGGAPATTGGQTGQTGGAATGGRTATGGSEATGGARTGGAVGTGGGTATGGATGGAGQEGGAAQGGRGGQGGKPGATGGNGGATAATGGSGMGGSSSEADVGGMFDGALVTYPCGTNHSSFDCDNVGCTNNQVTHTQTFTLGGKSGTVYDLTVRVRGIVEAYNYVGGTREAGDASVKTNGNLFLRGGAAQATNADGWDYDVYQLDVSPAVSGAPNTYFLNSVIKSENPHTSSTTQHLSFPLDYMVTFKVPGGGKVTLKQYDSNCKSIMNCGPTTSTCAPRKIVLDGSMPAAPASFSQPYQMPTGSYGQWLFFDVISAVPST